MSLVDERNEWARRFHDGEILDNPYLTQYIQHREDELWRSTRVLEELCEYVLHLEELCNITRDKD